MALERKDVRSKLDAEMHAALTVLCEVDDCDIGEFLRAYQRQRAAAKHRGIAWLFTFDSWCKVWVTSGHWAHRGIGRDRFQMARNGDSGPYVVDNVRIITHSQNARESRLNHPGQNKRIGVEKLLGRGRGWTRVGQRFQVTCSKRYVGTFLTEAAAEMAYANAVEARRAEGM
jgi:hypothetical protein